MTIEEIVAECERQGFRVKLTKDGFYTIFLTPNDKKEFYKKRSSYKRAQGECKGCGGVSLPGRSRCALCAEKSRQYAKHQYYAKKKTVAQTT